MIIIKFKQGGRNIAKVHKRRANRLGAHWRLSGASSPLESNFGECMSGWRLEPLRELHTPRARATLNARKRPPLARFFLFIYVVIIHPVCSYVLLSRDIFRGFAAFTLPVCRVHRLSSEHGRGRGVAAAESFSHASVPSSLFLISHNPLLSLSSRKLCCIRLFFSLFYFFFAVSYLF